jgi:uncharacterized membrane protein YfcA
LQTALFIIIGLAGGVLGGLGMGGGTLTIPMLVWFTGLGQHEAQTINLAAFIPMSVAALIIHIKNGYVKFKYLLTVSLPALILGIGASFLARRVPAGILTRCFGVFLIILGVLQFIGVVIKFVRESKAKKQQKRVKNAE